jgi:hypothetical protein
MRRRARGLACAIALRCCCCYCAGGSLVAAPSSHQQKFPQHPRGAAEPLFCTADTLDLPRARVVAEVASSLPPASGRAVGYDEDVDGPPGAWYRTVYVTDCGVPAEASTVMRCMSFGSTVAVPESVLRLRAGTAEAAALFKPHMTVLSLGLARLPALAAPAAPRTDAAPVHALVVGVAGGSLLHLWRRVLPARSVVAAVELDPAALALAREHMGLARLEASAGAGRGARALLRVHAGDGRAFLAAAAAGSYGLLAVDLDQGVLRGGAATWAHLARVLGPAGVLTMNYWSPEPLASLLTARIRNVLQVRTALVCL